MNCDPRQVTFHGKREAIFPPGDIWHFLLSWLRRGHHVTRWRGSRDAAQHPAMHGTAPTTKNHVAQMSTVPRLRNSALEEWITCDWSEVSKTVRTDLKISMEIFSQVFCFFFKLVQYEATSLFKYAPARSKSYILALWKLKSEIQRNPNHSPLLLSSLARTFWCSRRVGGICRMFSIHLCWNHLNVSFFMSRLMSKKLFELSL